MNTTYPSIMLGLITVLVSAAVAEPIKLGSFRAVGQNFSHAQLMNKDEQNAMIVHDGGVTKVSLLALPRLVQDRIKFYPEDYSVDSHKDRIKKEEADNKYREQLAERETIEAQRKQLESDLAIRRSIAQTELLRQQGDKSFWRGLVQPEKGNQYRFLSYYKSRQAQFGTKVNKKPKPKTS